MIGRVRFSKRSYPENLEVLPCETEVLPGGTPFYRTGAVTSCGRIELIAVFGVFCFVVLPQADVFFAAFSHVLNVS